MLDTEDIYESFEVVMYCVVVRIRLLKILVWRVGDCIDNCVPDLDFVCVACEVSCVMEELVLYERIS